MSDDEKNTFHSAARSVLTHPQDGDEVFIIEMVRIADEIVKDDVRLLSRAVKQMGFQVWKYVVREALDLRLLAYLLEKDPNQTVEQHNQKINFDGGFAVYNAIHHRHFEKAQILIDNGADINISKIKAQSNSPEQIEWRAKLDEFLGPSVKSATKGK
jgi:hypothetical protein